MDLLFCIKYNSKDEMPNCRIKFSVAVSQPQFLQSVVGEENRIEVLIDSWEGVVVLDSSVNLPPVWKLLSSLSTSSFLNEIC